MSLSAELSSLWDVGTGRTQADSGGEIIKFMLKEILMYFALLQEDCNNCTIVLSLRFLPPTTMLCISVHSMGKLKF